MPFLSGFFGMNLVKGQRDFKSINCLSIFNEKFHLYFLSCMDANVWNSTRIALNLSAPSRENANISGWQQILQVTCFLKISE